MLFYYLPSCFFFGNPFFRVLHNSGFSAILKSNVRSSVISSAGDYYKQEPNYFRFPRRKEVSHGKAGHFSY